MSEDDLTAEEQSAFEAMQEADEGPADPPPPADEGAPKEPEAGDKAEKEDPPVEFKSSRTEAEKPPEGFVPHQAMHAERVKRQELERKLEALEARLAPKQEEDQPPEYKDPLVDPEGFRRWAEYNSTNATKQAQEIRDQARQQQEYQQRMQEAARLEADFAKGKPDYPDAVQYLHGQRVAELQAQGYGDDEIRAQVGKEANAIFDAARAANMNPAELLYLRAVSAGFQSKPADPAPEDPTQKIEALARAERQTRSLGSGSGGAQNGALTAQQIAEMSEEEIEKISEADLRRAMGG